MPFRKTGSEAGSCPPVSAGQVCRIMCIVLGTRTKGGPAHWERPSPGGNPPPSGLQAESRWKSTTQWAAELLHCPDKPEAVPSPVSSAALYLHGRRLGDPRGTVSAILYSVSQDKVPASTHTVSACVQESFPRTNAEITKGRQGAGKQVAGRRVRTSSSP